MATETPAPAKKHRVVAWDSKTSESTSRRRLPRWAVIGGSILGVVLVALIIRVAFVLKELEQLATEGPQSTVSSDPSLAFAGRSRAESARQSAMRSLEAARKLPSQHPIALQQMIEVERLLDPADKAFGDRDYPRAIQLFDSIKDRADTYTTSMGDMRKAQDGYAKFLIDLTRLEKFKNLAPQKFEQALTAAGASQIFLDQGSFTPARQQMDEASKILGSVEESIRQELEAKLADGRSALAAGSGAEATAAFTRALELQPDNEIAIQGLERAKSIERVFALLAQAEALENSGELEKSRDTFASAFEIDGQSATAQAGVSRLKAAIKKRDFDGALARASAAAAENKWADAITAYEEALKIEADNADVKRQLAEARVKEREQRAQAMLDAAYAFERSYQWNEARRSYLELLAFQPGHVDAEEGLLRTGKVTRALLKFERLIEDAQSQAGRADFQGAILSFNEAMASKPAYLELAPDQQQLKDMLELQSKPVRLTFNSDGRTWVTISGVQLLGKFTTTTVSILPGNYEVIGRRKNYDDVREFLRIRAGETIEPITIIATKRSAR